MKVFLMSIALSLAIKYGGPILSIPSTTPIVLIAIFTPTIMQGCPPRLAIAQHTQIKVSIRK